MAVLAVGWTGCDRRGEERQKPPSIRVLFVARSMHDPVWPIVNACARRYQFIHRNVQVDCRAPRVHRPAEQRALLEALLDEAFDVLVVWPDDANSLRHSITQMTTSGRPAIVLGRDVPESGRTAFVGMDDRDIGIALARATARVARGRAVNVGVFHGGFGGPESGARLAGFREEIALHSSVRVVAERDWSGREFDAREMLGAEVQKYPRMHGWVLLEDYPVVSAPLDEPLVPSTAFVVFFSHALECLERLRNQTAHACIVMEYREVIERGLALAAQVIREKRLQVERFLQTPRIVTSLDVRAFDAQMADWARVDPSIPATMPAAR